MNPKRIKNLGLALFIISLCLLALTMAGGLLTAINCLLSYSPWWAVLAIPTDLLAASGIVYGAGYCLGEWRAHRDQKRDEKFESTKRSAEYGTIWREPIHGVWMFKPGYHGGGTLKDGASVRLEVYG